MNVGTVSPYLVVNGPEQDAKIPLSSGEVWKLGRSRQCAIELTDDTVSRNHAIIQRADQEYYCIDLGSQNGSFVNGCRVSTPVLLKNDDKITLGRTTITFRHSLQPQPHRPPSLGISTRQIFAQRSVTVLVVDIRGYTALAQTIDQSLLCRMIGSWFSEAEQIMQRYGSATQKFMGDAVMAVWVHQKTGNESEDILRILRSVTEFVEHTAGLSRRLALPQQIRVGVGLNTGVAAVGSPGSGELTALGDCVNAAFRFEKSTKDLRSDIALGQITFNYIRALRGSDDYFHPNSVKLKGYEQPLDVWTISFADLGRFLQAVPRQDV